MKLLKVFPDNPNGRYIELAAEAMRRGEIVVYPTDTLYAFGCDALNNNARCCRNLLTRLFLVQYFN